MSLCLHCYAHHPHLHSFPYTTLFRSSSRGAIASVAGNSVAIASVVFNPFPVIETTVVSSGLMRFCPISFLDRKSTRLNSSHPSISYAVFCLKKKNRCHP